MPMNKLFLIRLLPFILYFSILTSAQDESFASWLLKPINYYFHYSSALLNQ